MRRRDFITFFGGLIAALALSWNLFGQNERGRQLRRPQAARKAKGRP